jgi:hypothetical protein
MKRNLLMLQESLSGKLVRTLEIQIERRPVGRLGQELAQAFRDSDLVEHQGSTRSADNAGADIRARPGSSESDRDGVE